MKTAVIFYEGREVCRLEFDRVTISTLGFSFYVNNVEVAFFPESYGYVVLDALTSTGTPDGVLSYTKEFTPQEQNTANCEP